MDGDREAELSAICQACGLCCDGSLFGRVSLGPSEMAAARRNKLRVVEVGCGIEQPCPAHVPLEGAAEGARTCSVYAERPRVCREFACALLDRHRREGGPVEARLAIVAKAKTMLVTTTPESDPVLIEELRDLFSDNFCHANAVPGVRAR